VLTSRAVAESVDACPAGATMHGPTRMANTLACDLLACKADKTRIASIESSLAPGWNPPVRLVHEARVLGAVGVIELDQPVDLTPVASAAIDMGVWVRPFRNLVYTMPPFLSRDDLAAITSATVGWPCSR
jgi:adenosylmethionine-8-amino-7-oxononanoate aminotransferase